MATDTPEAATPDPQPAARPTYAEFVEAHRRGLYRFVARQCRTWQIPRSQVDPEDMVQEVFTEALKYWNTIDRPERWIYTVARRLLSQRIDQVANEIPTDYTDPDSRPEPTRDLEDSTYETVERADTNARLRADLRDAFQELTPNQAEAVYSKHAEGARSADIADRLGVNPKTVDVHAYRGRKKLRDRLEERILERIQFRVGDLPFSRRRSAMTIVIAIALLVLMGYLLGQDAVIAVGVVGAAVLGSALVLAVVRLIRLLSARRRRNGD
jgi:RNA polymerase sigma factor (sigma-70 family)